MKKLSGKVIFKLLLLLFIIILTISITTFRLRSNDEIVLDNRFVEHFSLSSDNIEEMVDDIQMINKEINYDGFLIRLVQTLGNEQVQYIAIDISFPEDKKLKDYISYGDNNEEDFLKIWPINMVLVEDIVDPEEVRTISYIELRNRLIGKKQYDLIQSNISYINVDKNTIGYIFCFDMRNSYTNGSTLSVLINGLNDSRGEQEIEITSKNYVISWVPTNINKGNVINARLIDRYGAEAGEIHLSRYLFKIFLPSSEFESSGEAINSLIIKTNDGEPLAMNGPGGGSFLSDNGRLSKYTLFRKLVSIEEIQSIEIDNYTIDYS